MFIKSTKALRNKKHWRCDLRVNTDPLALQMWKARRNWFSAATGKHIKRVCSQQPSSWLLHSLIYFLLFLRFCNTWLTIKWLFQHSLIPLEHGEYHSRIPHNGFSTSVLLSLLPRHSVVTCACSHLPVLVFEAAQTVDAHRHRMGALKAGLGGLEGLCNLKFSCYLQLWPEACYPFIKVPAGLFCVCTGPRPQALWEHSSPV